MNISPDFIIETTSEYFGYCERAVKGTMRLKDLCEVRMIIAYLLFKHSILDTYRIASKMNRRSDWTNYAIDIVITRKKCIQDFSKKFEMAEKHLLELHEYCDGIDKELINAPVNK